MIQVHVPCQKQRQRPSETTAHYVLRDSLAGGPLDEHTKSWAHWPFRPSPLPLPLPLPLLPHPLPLPLPLVLSLE